MVDQLSSKTLVERLLQAADGICKGPGGEPYWWGEVALLGATEIEHLQQRVAELERFEKMYSEATDIQGDDEVLRYITSGNSIPVTRCTVSADLIRQLVEGRRSQPPTSPASKHDLSELHSWLVDMSNESSPYNSQMLMKAANVVAERLQVPPNLLHKDFDSWFATIGLSYWPRLQEVWTAARAPVTKTDRECGACDTSGAICSNQYGICSRHGGRRTGHPQWLSPNDGSAKKTVMRCTCRHDTTNGAAHADECPVERALCGLSPETDACRIYEYDGAFKCYTHNRLWGAVSNPSQPCAGWKPESESDG